MITRKNGKTYIQFKSEALKEVINQWSWLLPWNGEFTPQELAEDLKSAYGLSNVRVRFDYTFLEYHDRSKETMNTWLYAGRITQDTYDMYCAIWDYYRMNRVHVVQEQYQVK